MTDGRDRRPGAVPDDDAEVRDAASDVRGGVDTDGDGLPDTLVDADGVDLLVLTDLDGDALADRVLRIGPDGAVHVAYPPGGAVASGPDAVGDGAPHPAVDAEPVWWARLFGWPSGPDG